MTTNLTRGGPSAHQTGVLWRLVRASMTIVGLIPPLVEDGELLVRPAPRLLWLGGVVSWGYLRRPRCRRPSSSAEAAGARPACRRACGSVGPARMGCRTAALFPNSSLMPSARAQIDGGYLNNMPVDVMRELGVDTVRRAAGGPRPALAGAGCKATDAAAWRPRLLRHTPAQLPLSADGRRAARASHAPGMRRGRGRLAAVRRACRLARVGLG